MNTPIPPASPEDSISIASPQREGSRTPASDDHTHTIDEKDIADQPPTEDGVGVSDKEAGTVEEEVAEEASRPTKPPQLEDGTIAGSFNAQTNYVPRSQIIIIFLALAIVIFTVVLDQTTLAVSSSVIATDLSAGSLTSFITGSYFLTSTSFQLIYGRVSDFFGRKPLILVFLAMFFIGSLGSSLSPDVISLVCFRAFTGIWGGGLITLGQTVIGDVVSLRERGKYQGILGSVMILGNGLGPVIGGSLAEKADWRDQYRMMLPLSCVSGLVAWRFLPLKKVHGDWKKKAKAVDWTGAVLTFIATTLVVLGLSWAGGSYSWSDAHVLAPIIIGIAFTFIFVLWQWKGCTPERPPLMPLSMFHNRIVCGAAITQFTNGWLTYVQMFYIPQFYQLAYGYSPIKAGALLLPLLCVQSLSSTLSGLIVSRTGRYREILLSGWILWSVGLGLFSTLDPSSGLGKQIGFSLITGFGVGQTLQVALVALQGAVPRKDMAVVTAVRNFARNLGAALGIAIASTIVNTLTVHDLTPQGWSTAQVRAALDNPSALFSSSSSTSSSLSPDQLNELRLAYSNGFRVVFLVLAGIAAASFFFTVALMRQRTLTREDDAALKEEGKRTVRMKRESKRAKKMAAAGVMEEKVAESRSAPQEARPQPLATLQGDARADEGSGAPGNVATTNDGVTR